jgi:molybdopterin synthase catalytic subunit
MNDSVFHFSLHEGPLTGSNARQLVEGTDAGCVVEFRGTVRAHARGKTVLRLEYQAYAPMVEAELRRISEEICNRHEILRIAVQHSRGVVEVGGCSVVLAIASSHRAAAFDAATEFMDALKERVPIWKKEIYSDQSSWIGQGS